MESTLEVFNKHLGDIVNKKVTKEIKNNREVVLYYDENDRKVGVKGAHQYWKLFKYDSSGNLIYKLDSEGNWEKFKYSEKTIIQFSNSMGEFWTKTTI